MKVIGLVGSNRKDGNTNTLVERILEGARSKAQETEKVFFADLSISPIGDCSACRKAGSCRIDDDFNALMDKVLESDCVIFGTPLYWYGPSSQMKAFMDRWVCRMHFDEEAFRARMKGKKCVLAVPHQDTQLSGAEHLLAIMEKTFAFMEMAYLGKIQTVAWRRWEAGKDDEALKYAFELGVRLVEMEDFEKATGSVTFNFSKTPSES
jgi:multimeric flavodoxin WrbA